MKTNLRLLSASISAAVLSMAPVQFTQAQMLEEVLVTAQKKTASVNDVPVTMTALGSADIKERY